ncbi:MAG: sugar phosphate isomerase/epimerase family protein, partial [Alphaproteobacteria bacterium]
MKIGMITDSLGHLALDELLPTAAEIGLEALEFACGNWSSAPHVDLEAMLESEGTRREFMAKVSDHGLEISALNCSGNQLAPGEYGRRHDEVVRKTFRLAREMGIHRIVMMSGLPGGPGDANPNWITTAWPPEATRILEWQWNEVAIPYWRELAAFGRDQGVERISIEIHGTQLVYNTETMLKLREAVDETVGANFDPSHMMWMGGEPLTAVRRLGDAIFYVHAKDTRIDRQNADPNTLLETKTTERVAERSWNYVTLGYGHDESWWRDFVSLL